MLRHHDLNVASPPGFEPDNGGYQRCVGLRLGPWATVARWDFSGELENSVVNDAVATGVLVRPRAR